LRRGGAAGVVTASELAAVSDLAVRATRTDGWALIMVGYMDGAGVVLARSLGKRTRARLERLGR
jgi:hypothetical protein